MTRPRRKVEQQIWINEFNKMSETLAKVSAPATYSDLTKKYDGATKAVSKVAEYLSTPANSNMNQVNHRPAVQ